MTLAWLFAPDGYSLARIQHEFIGRPITGVIHVGAQLGSEWVYYDELGIDNVTWVEANPAVIERLRATVEPHGHRVIEALVGDEDGKESPFNVTNIDGLSSSIFEFGTHKDFSPDMVFEKRLALKMRTLDSLVEEHGITGVNMLVMDTQGAEGLVLDGAQGLLPQLMAVYTEYNLTQVYEGCIELPELDRKLFGFARKKTWHGGPGWGDCIYVRDQPAAPAAQPMSGFVVGGAVSGVGGQNDLSPFVAAESRGINAVSPAPLKVTGVQRREGEPRVCVLVPSWNCAPFIERCLRSLAEQTRRPDSVMVIDDASTDDAYFDLCTRLLPDDTSWSVVRNDFNMKMPRNLWWAMLGGAWHDGPGPDDVVFLLDGDDFLPPGALEKIAEVYRDDGLWLTWGSYERDPKGPYAGYMPNPATDWPEHIKLSRRYRVAAGYEIGWVPFNHPLTFRRWLFDLLDEADFKDDQGAWFQAGYDFALMVPLTELAHQHGRFLQDVLYIYEEGNPHSDAKIRGGECGRVHNVVRSRKPREALAARP
jgi:FkbM family methyltransferase